jgi:hypothetical protein
MMDSTAVFGGDRRMTTLDLVLATVIAIGLPFACRFLFGWTGGATLPLLLYYGVCCLAVVRWRKGTLDYRWPRRWPWVLFGACLVVPLLIAATNWGAYPHAGAWTAGALLTLVVWSPLNAALEQLSWLYVLDAWRNRWDAGPLRSIGLTIGFILMLALVGLIHVVFWDLFLLSGEDTPWSPWSIPLNVALTLTYVALYYRSRSQWPVFFVHLVADLQLILLSRYSMLPDL